MEKYPIEITEKRVVKRITARQTLVDFLDAFNVERGIVYTIKLLATKPGRLVRYYLTDGRYKIVNAFRLLIITTAISLILLNVTNSFEFLYKVQTPNGDEEAAALKSAMDLMKEWYNLYLWLSIPCYALASFLLFRKYEKFNYAEHLVIQSFLISVSNLLIILTLPLSIWIGVDMAFVFSFVFGSFYYLFLFYDVFKRRTFGFFMRTIFSYVFGNFLYFLLISVVMAVLMVSSQ